MKIDDPIRSVTSGLMVYSLGGVVMLGWILNLPWVVQVLPDFAPMQFNTALCFLLAGLALLLLEFSLPPVLYRIPGILISCIGALTLIQYGWAVDFGIDQLFTEQTILTKTSHPGRMAPNTALCFLLAGIFFISQHRDKENSERLLIPVIVTFLIIVLSFPALLGYLLKLEKLYGWAEMTRMAVHTSIGFQILAGAFYLVLKHKGLHANSTFIGYQPGIVGLFVFLLSLSIAAAEYSKGAASIHKEVKLITTAIKQNLSTVIEKNSEALIRMSRRWETGEDRPAQAVWEDDARYYREHLRSLHSIAWMDRNYRLQWMVPKTVNQATAQNFIANKYSSDLKKSESIHKVVSTKITAMDSGEKIFLIILPLTRQGTIDGFLIGTVLLEEFIHINLEKRFADKMSFAISEDNQTKFASGQIFPDWEQEETIEFINSSWVLSISPKQHWLDGEQSSLPFVFLVTGLMAGVLLGWLVYLYQQIRSQNQKTLNLLNNLPVEVVVLDSEERIEMANDDWNKKKVSNVYLDNFPNDSDREIIKKSIDQVRRGDLPEFVMEFTRQERSENTWLLLFAKRLSERDQRVLISHTNITRVKATESELEAIKTRNELILESAGEGIYGLDALGKTTFINPAASSMIGYDLSELIGKPQHDILHHSKEDGTHYPTSECPIHSTIADGRTRHVSNEVFWRKDGTSFPVEYISTPIWENDVLSGAVVTFSDITVQMQLSREIVQAQENLETVNAELEAKVKERTYDLEVANAELIRSNNELDSFTYIASHDLKEPLRTIEICSQDLLEDYMDKLDEEGKESLSGMAEASVFMKNLISDLLTYSRVDSHALNKVECSLTEMILSIENTLQTTLSQENVVIRIPETLPNIWVDYEQFTEVLQSIIENAIKYNNKSEKLIEIGVVENKPDADSSALHPATRSQVNGSSTIFIRDNGIGIRDKHLEKIFRIFKRLHGKNDFGGGTGTGLTIAKKIIDRHGGKVWVESEIDVGSAFFIKLNGLPHGN
ncbi:MAG: PAS domain S-box protein [Candidatus Nitrohelix vancouverensis]|uniref:histidine kinase n=1 Tax=Candidatus Nitrohelix vancouverensis TaxID=2705534 RepID=A0A7T0C487_9BACT|nr:MAG: PAS domain S-box protein [Candidatus Nitrohelix vancouverensis]